MDDDVKSLVQQYIEIRKKQRTTSCRSWDSLSRRRTRPLSTLELYYHIEASEDQWTQAWKAAKRDFLADGERTEGG